MENPIDANGVVMSNGIIKNIADTQIRVIKNATDMLHSLRSVCPHEDTHIGNYSYRIGVIQDAEICDYCGAVIEINK